MAGLLADTKAVVTASTGALGAGIALRLASEGADVVLNGRIAANADQLEQRIRDLGRDVVTIRADVCDPAGAEAVVQAGLNRWGRIDILVNNAGGIDKGIPVIRPFWEIPKEEWDLVFRQNVDGTFYCTQAVLPGMMSRRAGKIINIGSVSWAAEPMHAHYSAAKASLNALTRSLATQVGPYNINVNLVSPGRTRTGAMRGRLEEKDFPVSEGMTELGSGSFGAQPLGRVNDPSDIANVVVFLASEQARNISGEFVTVAGGLNPSL
jgi:NAD(P)-dependent dehydrogenase (short-subunit alcohol dehydrogenase family)